MSASRTKSYTGVICYSVSNALSSALTMGYAWSEEGYSPLLASFAGAAFGVLVAASSYYLSSDDQDEEETPTDSPVDSKHVASSPKPTPEEHEAKYTALATPEEKSASCVTTSTALQTVFTLLSAAGSGTDRYFVVRCTYKLFNTQVNGLIFWPVLLGSTLVFNQPFELTNENWSSTKAIDRRWGELKPGAKPSPCYAQFFARNLSSPCARSFIRGAGSADHTAAEMLSLSGYISRKTILYLADPRNRGVRNLVISLASIVGAYLASFIFLETFLFEGGRSAGVLSRLAKLVEKLQTEKAPKAAISESLAVDIAQNKAQLLPDPKESDAVSQELKISPAMATFLLANITVIGTLKHGESSAAPLYVIGCSIAEAYPDQAYWIIPTTYGLTAALGICTAIGNYLIEIPEVREKIQNLSTPLQGSRILPDPAAAPVPSSDTAVVVYKSPTIGRQS